MSQTDTDTYHKTGVFSLVKCIRRPCVWIILDLVWRKSIHFSQR